MIEQGRDRHRVRYGVIHCAATRPEWMDGRPLADKKAEIKRWHLERGWKDIGYHWLVDRDGQVIMGRRETAIGAGVQGFNRGVIHVCLIGGHGSSENDTPTEHFTAPQLAATRTLMAQIEKRAGSLKWSGHNEHAAKACPGFRVPLWLGKKPLEDTIPPESGVGAVGAALAALLASIGQNIPAIIAVLLVFGAIALMRRRK